MSVLMGASSADMMPVLLKGVFTPASAVSFLVFSLLYTPCAAAVSAVKKEMNSGMAAAAFVLIQCAVAWIVSFIAYNLALIIF